MKIRYRIVILKLLAAFVPLCLFCSCRCEKPAGEDRAATFRSTTPITEASQATETTATAEGGAVSVAASDLMRQRVPRGVSESMLVRKGYIASYNKQRRTPNWVAWVLTREHTYGRLLRDDERFEEDPDVAEPRATYQDYYNSRYDRGHMCPAGDNKWDAEAMRQTFLMTNICPQNHGLNKDDWNELEMQCREWARRWGEIVIACGPVYQDGEGRQRYIGRNRVAVPSHFFKVVYRPRPQPLAVGFIFSNNGSSQPWRRQAVSVDEVERITGIDFFNRLPDDVENVIEALSTTKGW